MWSRPRRRREEGTSAIELVLYMPLLMIAIILTIQFALVYLGNQAVSAAAREGMLSFLQKRPPKWVS